MCANPQSNWLNTIAVRASYILHILKRFPWWKPRKTGGEVVYPPRQKTKTETSLSFWALGKRPFKLANEIGEMACSTTAWCSRGHALNSILKKICFCFSLSQKRHSAFVLKNCMCNALTHWTFHMRCWEVWITLLRSYQRRNLQRMQGLQLAIYLNILSVSRYTWNGSH